MSSGVTSTHVFGGHVPAAVHGSGSRGPPSFPPEPVLDVPPATPVLDPSPEPDAAPPAPRVLSPSVLRAGPLQASEARERRPTKNHARRAEPNMPVSGRSRAFRY